MKRRIFDRERHAHFLTFSCYGKRRYLNHDRCKKIVLGTFSAQLKRLDAICVGFVIMPNHVHAIVWFKVQENLSELVKQWKRTSSYRIKQLQTGPLAEYGSLLPPDKPVWQARYYDFNLYSRRKIQEKLNYMHGNPVRAGLVDDATSWPWSSARWYELGKSVGIEVQWID